MKTNFFEELKKFVINEHQEDQYFIQYVRYYETLLQNKEVIEPLLHDMENWRVNIHHEDDKTEGYTYGKWMIYLWDYEGEEPEEDDWFTRAEEKSPDYHYEIELTRDERYWGYCQCKPEMEGYNEKYKCCGDGCDWVAPSFTFRKIKESYGKFKGAARDIWELEEKWMEYLESYENKIKQQRLDNIEEQLSRLIEEKRKLLNK
ncbi:hypothetical protein CHH83_01835 [Bacillus sp. 7586-K]|nr:hypothetical protein CHH83_01835 [Bacillus sp. 7586-K]